MERSTVCGSRGRKPWAEIGRASEVARQAEYRESPPVRPQYAPRYTRLKARLPNENTLRRQSPCAENFPLWKTPWGSRAKRTVGSAGGAGKISWSVGGCRRAGLVGRKPKDLRAAVSAGTAAISLSSRMSETKARPDRRRTGCLASAVSTPTSPWAPAPQCGRARPQGINS